MSTLDIYPAAYRNRKANGFRPAVRIYRDGKPCGSKAAAHLFMTQAGAECFARLQALRVALQFGDCVRVH